MKTKICNRKKGRENQELGFAGQEGRKDERKLTETHSQIPSFSYDHTFWQVMADTASSLIR